MTVKRMSPTWRRRIKAGRRVGWATFLVAFGLMSGLISIFVATGRTIHPAGVVLALLACVAFGLGAAWARGHMKALPDTLVDEMNADGTYTIRFCSEEHLREACEMTRPYYRHEYVDPDVACQWLFANPHGFVEILNQSGDLCACFGILGLEQSFMAQFIAGRVSDTQMRSRDVLPLGEAKAARHLYISGVVVREPESFMGRKRAWVMIWAILWYLREIYGLDTPRDIYAISVNPESERLMRGLNLTFVQPGRARADECNLYLFTLTADTWNKLLSRIGDMSSMCTVDLAIAPPALAEN